MQAGEGAEDIRSCPEEEDGAAEHRERLLQDDDVAVQRQLRGAKKNPFFASVHSTQHISVYPLFVLLCPSSLFYVYLPPLPRCSLEVFDPRVLFAFLSP